MATIKENVTNNRALQIINKLLDQLSTNVVTDEHKCNHTSGNQHKYATKLTPLPDIQVLSDRVICVLGQNPRSMTLQGTNTYLVGLGKQRFLIDTGEGIASYITVLKKAMKENGIQSIQGIICTHWHYDHINGIPSVRSEFGANIPIYKYCSENMDSKLNLKFAKIEDKQTFKCEGATLIAHYTPGHCDDHIALELVEENGIFSGDCVLGEGSTVFSDLYLYMLSLKKLLTFECDVMFPGHGPMIKNGQKKITEYINHRNHRETQIIEALRQKRKERKTCDSWVLCDIVYDKTPKILKKQAHFNLMHHLNKLVTEKRVRKNENNTYELIE